MTTATETPTKAYAVAYFFHVDFGDQIIEYIERIDSTLAPYGGRFLVHGGNLETVEGDWNGDIVLIEFPSKDAAREWYGSPGYQDILPLRTENSRALVGMLEGVPADYQATQKIAEVLGQSKSA